MATLIRSTPSDGAMSRLTSKLLGQRGTRHQCMGHSCGGLTTKMVALVDALGNLVRFLLLPG